MTFDQEKMARQCLLSSFILGLFFNLPFLWIHLNKGKLSNLECYGPIPCAIIQNWHFPIRLIAVIDTL